MSILRNFKRLITRRQTVHEVIYSGYGDYKAVLQTTKKIKSNFSDEEIEAMGKLALEEFLSDFELDRIAENIDTRFNVSQFGGVDIYKNGVKEIVINIQ